MPTYSPTGKPLCIRCHRLATRKYPYRSFGNLRYVFYCSVHALFVYNSSLLEDVC